MPAKFTIFAPWGETCASKSHDDFSIIFALWGNISNPNPAAKELKNWVI